MATRSESRSDRPLRTRSVGFGWADVPTPRDMSFFDRDTEVEETGPEPLRLATTGREIDWDIDDWGDDD